MFTAKYFSVMFSVLLEGFLYLLKNKTVIIMTLRYLHCRQTCMGLISSVGRQAFSEVHVLV